MTDRLLTLASLAAALLPGCVPPQPETPFPAVHLTEPTTGRSYALYVPSYYTKDQAWPLVVALHGTFGFDSPDWEITSWKDVAEKRGLIVAAPELRSVQGIMPVEKEQWLKDLDSDEKAILAVIDDVRSRYNIATIQDKPPVAHKGNIPVATKPHKPGGAGPAQTASRPAILLSGFSAGGFPLYYTALRNPERFHMMIAMGANSSPDIFERVSIVPELLLLHIAIVFGRDDLKKVQDESWQAYAWLRSEKVRCFQTERRQAPAGHLRRPELQYQLWSSHLPHPAKP